MTTLYWTCLGGGFALTLLMLVVGEALEAALDAFDAVDFGDVFDPLAAVAGASLFGATGLVLDAALGLPDVSEAVVAGVVGVLGAVLMHVFYVKPMKRSENSTAFSVREYAGKTGELTTGVTATGYGEVVVRMGASTTFQTAASFSGAPIPTGTAVVVVEVDPDGVLRVAPLDTDDVAGSPVQAPIPARLQTQ